MKIRITIEPGKFTGAVIEWIGNHRRTSAAFMVLLSFVALWAAPITKPHTFSNGGIVSASEINANFDTLYTKVNELDSRQVPILKDSAGNVFGRILQTGMDASSYPNYYWVLSSTGYIYRVETTQFSIWGKGSVYWTSGNCTSGPHLGMTNIYYVAAGTNYTSANMLTVVVSGGTYRFFRATNATYSNGNVSYNSVNGNPCNPTSGITPALPLTEISMSDAGIPTTTPTMPLIIE